MVPFSLQLLQNQHLVDSQLCLLCRSAAFGHQSKDVYRSSVLKPFCQSAKSRDFFSNLNSGQRTSGELASVSDDNISEDDQPNSLKPASLSH
ncbi:hypothetical protein PoB_006225300 [Plakobranchus ocellatus]|uniref:Uncharacterized protein n=1 Tax=Plakobranchus ocellatus TaxID=259542 RepID=A0AAV4CV24_9GAST|nr:hypothetical protein PoB_006225300 [Plakobranchus ocellatus]